MFSRVRVPETASNTPPGRAKTERDKLRTREKSGFRRRLKLSHPSHPAPPSQTVSQIPYCLTVSNRLTNPILPHRLKPSHKSQTVLTVSNRLTNPILPHRLKPSHKSHTASPSQTVSSSCPTVSNRLTNPILPHRLKPSHKSHLPHRLKLSHPSHPAPPSQTVSQIPNCLIVSNRLTPATEECGHARLRRHHSKRVYTNLTPRSPQ